LILAHVLPLHFFGDCHERGRRLIAIFYEILSDPDILTREIGRNEMSAWFDSTNPKESDISW